MAKTYKIRDKNIKLTLQQKRLVDELEAGPVNAESFARKYGYKISRNVFDVQLCRVRRLMGADVVPHRPKVSRKRKYAGNEPQDARMAPAVKG